MAEKDIKARIQHKHDTEANWSKATSFIPKAGELIIYDKDETHDFLRVKIGDGSSLVNDLEFIVDTSPDLLATVNYVDEAIADNTSANVMIVNAYDSGADKTGEEILAHFNKGGSVICKYDSNYYTYAGHNNSTFEFTHYESEYGTIYGVVIYPSGGIEAYENWSISQLDMQKLYNSTQVQIIKWEADD